MVYVFLIAVVAFMFGGFLYSPLVLGRQWQEEMGLEDGDISQEEGMKAMGASFVVVLIEVVGLYFLKQSFDQFLIVGLVVGIIVIFRELANQLLFENRTKRLVGITLLHATIEFSIIVLGIHYLT